MLSEQEEWDNELKKKREIVDEENIIEVISLISGVPITSSKDESHELEINLEKKKS